MISSIPNKITRSANLIYIVTLLAELGIQDCLFISGIKNILITYPDTDHMGAQWGIKCHYLSGIPP